MRHDCQVAKDEIVFFFGVSGAEPGTPFYFALLAAPTVGKPLKKLR
jgi:hypothetical protein